MMNGLIVLGTFAAMCVTANRCRELSGPAFLANAVDKSNCGDYCEFPNLLSNAAKGYNQLIAATVRSVQNC